ncbi:MAG TPA: ribonuclease HI [Planctomycetes bacterium]|nr:ribonuclease HI [Planctomycetota bacterium]
MLRMGQHEKELVGGDPDTTNNRMEMIAAIKALGALIEPCEVDLYTDSKYLIDGITKWLPGWQRRGWKTASKKPVKNEDLWRKLAQLEAEHRITWHWVKGHAGDENNERVDRLAVREAEQQKAGG